MTSIAASPEECTHAATWDDHKWASCADCGAAWKLRAALNVNAPSELDPGALETLLAYIRKGAYIWVACQAAGIRPSTLREWRRKGNQADLYPDHAAFCHELDAAFAEARIGCEIEVARAEPKYWLSKGPGRDRGNPDQPGWTDGTAKIELTGEVTHNLVPRFDLSKLTDAELDEQERLSSKAAILEVTSGSEP